MLVLSFQLHHTPPRKEKLHVVARIGTKVSQQVQLEGQEA